MMRFVKTKAQLIAMRPLPTTSELETIVVNSREQANYYDDLYSRGLIPFLPSDGYQTMADGTLQKIN